MQQDEILNIEYHRKRLVLKALNTMPFQKDAATALGISKRELNRLKAIYNIKQDMLGNYHFGNISQYKLIILKQQ